MFCLAVSVLFSFATFLQDRISKHQIGPTKSTISRIYRNTMSLCVHTCDQGEALDAGEVSVLDGHDTSLSKQLLWIIIDQLSVKKERKRRLVNLERDK